MILVVIRHTLAQFHVSFHAQTVDTLSPIFQTGLGTRLYLPCISLFFMETASTHHLYCTVLLTDYNYYIWSQALLLREQRLHESLSHGSRIVLYGDDACYPHLPSCVDLSAKGHALTSQVDFRFMTHPYTMS